MAWNTTSIFTKSAHASPLPLPVLNNPFNPFSSLLITTLVTLVLTTYALLYHLQTTPLSRHEPPIIPSRLPFFGHILGMLLHGGRYVKNIGLNNPHLPIFTLPLPHSRIYIITSPTLALPIQRLPPKLLSFTPLVPSLTRLVLNLSPSTVKILTQNLDPLPGEKKGFLAEMHEHITQHLAPSAGGEMSILLSSLTRHLATAVVNYSTPEKEIDLLPWIRHLVASATANCFYGTQNPLATDPGLEKAFWDFDGGLGGLLLGIFPSLTARRAHLGREKLVTAFEAWLTSNKHHSTDVPPIVKERIQIALRHGFTPNAIARSEVSFLFAGIVNTATTGFWGVLHVCFDGDLLRDIREELGVDRETERIVWGGKKEKKLLGAVVSECLRMNSDTYSTRVVVPGEGVEVDVKEKKYWFKGGAIVQISGGTIHSSKNNWGEDVHEFKPERFLTGGVNYKNFRAFGGGKTLCPGRHFAVAVVRLLIAMVVTRFEIEVLGERLPGKEDGVLPVHVLEPKERVMVRVRVRDEREFGELETIGKESVL